METVPFLLLICLLIGQYVCDGDAQLVQCHAADREALLDFKMGLNGSFLSSWQGTDCCRWMGIHCDNATGAVISLRISDPTGRHPSDWKIRPSLAELKSLKYLGLSLNNFHGRLPAFLGNMTSLLHLDLSLNYFRGEIPNSLGQLKNLTLLSLCYNLLEGLIPASIGNLRHLIVLDLSSNKLNGTLPDSLGMLSELIHLDVHMNELKGVISETHFLRLSELKRLYLSENSFILNVISNWIPPFQISYVDLGSCHLGPSFPTWLRSQEHITALDLSNCSISGTIPNWFWDMSGNLVGLNLSFNHLEGHLPNLLNISREGTVDCSYNNFQGPIPLADVYFLELSNNQFTGPIPSNIGQAMPNLRFLYLSSNQLTGEIPGSIAETIITALDLSRNNLTENIPSSMGNCSYLLALDLQDNNLSGEIPRSLGQLRQLQTLHLGKNKLSGEIPSSLKCLTSLETLDLSNNRLTGKIPPWIGKALISLKILNMRSNNFYGEIPSTISDLASLHFLDIAENQLNGSFPSAFGNLKAMTHLQNITRQPCLRPGFGRGCYNKYQENIFATIHGHEFQYTKTVSLLAGIDLSGNNLSGKFPEEITKLVGLEVLNLSRNYISGQIPENISKMHQLLSLDLSSNSLSGPIPQEIFSLTFLESLNLSNNNLSGRIPYKGQMTTFGASSFAGNSGLCGEPLTLKCPGDYSNNRDTHDDSDGGRKDEADDNNSFIDTWFYMSIGMGFAVGLVLPFLIFSIKRSWGGVYFALVDLTAYKLSTRDMKAAIRSRI
ncbi:receptor-like protein EIX1 [Manihot esculenta]|uniref:receptor-like protein EIX1 n=1 Tax=Manihot esculenta TaxID=3983 RepID=UPI000B5D4F8E|nr:receptor-like protein EIX1 [Manihot esculenta]